MLVTPQAYSVKDFPVVVFFFFLLCNFQTGLQQLIISVLGETASYPTHREEQLKKGQNPLDVLVTNIKGKELPRMPHSVPDDVGGWLL